MHVLLVEPEYYTQYPPLGLLKIASYHKSKGDSVELMRVLGLPSQKPDRIYVTSLFTYAWQPVHDAVLFYRRLYPDVSIWLGGIYASLMPEHAVTSGADHLYKGLHPKAEQCRPDYSLVPEWGSSIIFSSRGCIRKCPFCAVPVLEGKLNSTKKSIRKFVYPGHSRITFWDNNFLASPYKNKIFDELADLDRIVDFNQGLDARLINEGIAGKISDLRMDRVHLSYDSLKVRKKVENAIECLTDAGVNGRKVVVYTLFNFSDNPEDFFQRVRDLLRWGVASYPMRYEPLNALEKNKHISPAWDPRRVEMVAKARRVIGYGGTFPPYKGLVKKFLAAGSFDEAFELRNPSRAETHQSSSLHLPLIGRNRIGEKLQNAVFNAPREAPQIEPVGSTTGRSRATPAPGTP